MSGLFELLIIVAFIAAAVFDAVKRNRQREERKREMEEREATAEAIGEDGEDRTRRTESMGAERSWEPERESKPERARKWDPEREQAPERAREWEAERSPEPEPESERETAETMVPEDLWAILTGQAPQGGGRTGSEAESPPKQPHIPAPVPSDRTAPREERPDPTRRSRKGQEIGDHTPPARSTTRRSSRWMDGVDEVEARDRDAMAEGEAAAFGSMEEPWDLFDDIAEGEILDGEGGSADALGSLDSPYAARADRGRRGSGRGEYTRLLETGRLEDLRKAVVLREVLGRPVGFRDQGDELLP
ncbi:MAG: hypothetical protein EA351_15370 [Gemmatimonadales bacterium]|nr:MAG: hypothetical protein EA351_15370 [Gemmatimonadales bacterium]